MVMKKIFDSVFDEEVHSDFLKFGRGEYKNKYLIDGKKQAKKWAIKTGAEYANFLVRKCLEKIDGSVDIKGVIISTSDLRDEINFEIKKVSNFQGVRKHVIESNVESSQILDLMEKYPRVFFALSFSGDNFVLKIKPKGPKSEKKGKDDEGPVVDFCSLKTENQEIIDELFFGVGDFKEVFVSHTINVTDIVYPANVESLKPAEIREIAKRKGIVIRNVNADGIEKTSEAEFVV
ncbi:hypothetical protein KAI32_03220 [Candidatus Pacearchaeota archaeon]|nr:hypothetical protein [Candidatus Pacearchaeota archaeon]